MFCGFIFRRRYNPRWNETNSTDGQFHFRKGCGEQELRGAARLRCLVNGKVLLKTGAKASGRIQSSRANPRRSEPFAVELTTISVNRRKVPLNTNRVHPGKHPDGGPGAAWSQRWHGRRSTGNQDAVPTCASGHALTAGRNNTRLRPGQRSESFQVCGKEWANLFAVA